MSFHVSAQSVRAVAGGLVAAATLLSGLALAPTAMAADSATADNAPSVAGHAYNELPYNNPDVTVTQIDNSALPSYMRNPIGQNEGIDTPNDLSQNYYSADASALSYDGKLFVFTGHDEASPDYGSFNMKDWGVYVTDEDGLNQGKWTHYKTIAKADLFSWATGDGAYAGQVVADDNGTPSDTSDDWFYYYVPVKDKASEAAGQDPFAIGVAKSKSPLGPWKDAIGKPLLTTSQTQIETIDPAFFVDEDGTGYLHFGTFGTQLAIKMKKDATTGRTSYTEVETKADGTTPNLHTMKDADSNANGPKGFFEAAWVFRKGDTYYNVYDGGKPGSGTATCVESNYQACIQYSTSDSPLGPWKYQGVIVPSGSATTMHPSVLQFGDKWYVTYHTGDKEGGTDFRRAVCIDEVDWTADGQMVSTAHPTKAEKTQPSTNVAPYAKVSATFTETPAWKGSVNDGRVLQTAVVPPNHWTNYRSIPQSQSGDSLVYQWDGTVRVNSSKVWFDVDSNALRAPASWKIQYLDADGTWKDVTSPSGYTTTTGKANPNTVTFDAVTTTALKLDMTGQAVDGGYASVAVAEWEVGAADSESPAITAPKGVTTATGTAPTLPATVDVKYGDTTVASPVIWRPVAASSYAKAGSFKAYGVVAGVPGEASEQGNVSMNVTVQDGYKPAADKEERTLTLTADDGTGSGVASIEYRIGTDGQWATYSKPIAAPSASRATVYYRATDKAGNVSASAKTDIPSDTSVPLTGYIEGDATATDVDGKASGWVKGAAALNDGKIIPDITIANEDVWGTWPNTGEMRLDYEWDREVTIDSSRVQFTSDDGGLGIPASWELQYWDALANNGAGNFVDIPDATYTVTANSPSAGWATGDAKGWSDGTWNTPVKTTKLRMVITSGSASPAVAEWQVHAIDDSTPEPPEPTPIDKTELKQALADSPKADDASKYTETSWAEYAAVLDSAQQVYKAEDATEAAVVDAATQLKQAAKKLVLVATVQDRAALSAQLDAAAAVDRTKWTDESLAVLDSAVATANALTSDGQAAQSDVQAATEAISDAIAGLVEKSTTKPGQGGDKPGSGTDKPNQGNDSNQNKGDADSGKHKKIPDTGAAVLGVGILAVVLAVAGVIILKRRKSGTC